MKPIESERLAIRPLQNANALEVIRIHSIPEVSRYQGWEPTSEDEIRSLVDHMAKGDFLAPDQWFQFSIIERAGLRLIGDCGVCAGAKEHRQAKIGVTLDPFFQKQGYAQEAIRALLHFIFRETETHRIYASIDPRNEASIRLFERLGFRREAHLVKSLWFKGEWADDLIMAILKEEWIRPNQAAHTTPVSAPR